MRASWTTGYCGATTPIRASIVSRWATAAATSPRASSATCGSASVSARWRSKMLWGVRCPNSASKIAAKA